MCPRAPVPSNNQLPPHFPHRIHDRPNSFNRRFHNVAIPHPLLRIPAGANSCGCSRGNDVAGFEREHRSKILDKLIDIEKHEFGVRALHLAPVELQVEVQVMGIGDFVGCHDIGPHRRKGVLSL